MALLAFALGAASALAQQPRFRAGPNTGFRPSPNISKPTGHWQSPAACAATRATQHHNPCYLMIPIDLVPGKTDITPNALNSKGRVIGFGYDASDDLDVAYMWFKGGGTRPLPVLPGVFNTWPFSINDRDEIVGQDLLGDPAAPLQIGWFWKPGMKQYAVLSPLRDGDQNVGVNQIDHAGRIVGYSGPGYPDQVEAVLWESYKVAPTPLKGPPGAWTSARAINAKRPPQLAGAANLKGTDTWLALQWRAPHLAPDVLPDLGGGQAIAVSIKDNKQIAGWSATDSNDPFGTAHAVLWEDGQVIDLAPSNLWSLASSVNSLNHDGQIVGGVVMADGLEHAALWETACDDIKMIDLNDCVAQTTSHFFFYYADGINDDGSIIVDAYDLRDPAQLNRAFLLVPLHGTGARR